MRSLKIFLVLILIPAYSCLSQDITEAEPFKVTGQISAFGEKYSHSGSGTSAHKPTTGRLQVNVNFSFFDVLQIPLTGILATDQVAFRQNISQLAIHPKYKWITLHAGTFSPQFSELTLNDASTLGGGVDLTPGNFHFSFAGGRIDKGIGVNNENIPVSYARDLYGMQAGYGNIEGSYVDINIVRSKDNASSLPDTLPAAPQDNMVASVRFQLKLLDNRLTFANELSGSAFTKNTRAPESKDSNVGLFDSFFDSRTSSTTDWAMINKRQYMQDLWSADLKTTYIRSGYISFGCSQMQPDRFEYLFGGKVRLLENRLFLNSSIGHRRDNLAGDKENTTKRLVFNFNSSYQITSFFGFDLIYGTNNVDIRNSNDTMTISNVNNIISLIPRFMFSTEDIQHFIVTNISYQNSDNSTKGFGRLINIKTLTGVINYTLTFPSPLSLNLSAVYIETTADTLKSKIMNITPTANYSFFDNKLSASLGLQFGIITIGDQDPDIEMFPQLNLNYNIAPRNTLAFSITHRMYKYGSTLMGGNFQESIATLRYTLSF
jgi:hypothetical protein